MRKAILEVIRVVFAVLVLLAVVFGLSFGISQMLIKSGAVKDPNYQREGEPSMPRGH